MVGLRRRPRRRARLAGVAPATRDLLTDQYRFDEVYEQAVVQPGRDLGDVLTVDVERYGAQGAMEGMATLLVDAGRGLRAAQGRPGAHVRVRDDRRGGDHRGHLRAGDAVGSVPWVSAIVLLPLLGALSMFAVPPAPAGSLQARIHALVTAGGTLVLAAILIGLFDRDASGLQFVDRAGWAEEVGLFWDVGVDGLSLWLLALCAVVFLLVVVAVCWRTPERPRAFLAMVLLAETGLLGLFAASQPSSTSSGRRCSSRSTS